jgi:hypothetical protein
MSDDAKALPHVATALIAKRRELAGMIEDLQRQLKIAVCDFDHIQASLRIFVPDLDQRVRPPDCPEVSGRRHVQQSTS